MDAKALVEKQRAFFYTGQTKEYTFRREALEKLEQALVTYEDRLCEALYRDLHKSASESNMTEIGMTKSELRFVKKHLRTWMKPAKCRVDISQMPARTYTVAEPYGVVLVMAPWNYPVLLCLDPLIDALAAGNCVILKPSAYAPHVSSVLKEMIGSIFEEHYVAVIEGGRNENAQLLEQRFDYIFFTGGVTVGKLVLEKAAQHVTPVTLELGGKSPCIIDETADLKVATKRVAFGKLLNSGQTCVAPDYVVAHVSVKEEFIRLLMEQIEVMERGDALANPDWPRIINEKHFDRVCGLMANEHIAYGGRSNRETLQIEPTILDEVTIESAVMGEEIFGPLIPVLTYQTREELQAIVHTYEKPLAFYLFTKSAKMKEWATKTFSFGGGCINNTILHLATTHMPFGGVGYSGMGGYHGKYGFETFSHRKSMVDSMLHPDIPFRYQPFEAWKNKIINMIMG